MGSEERKGKREILGEKVQNVRKAIMSLSLGRQGKEGSDTESPRRESNDGSVSPDTPLLADASSDSAQSSPGSRVQARTHLLYHTRNDNGTELKELLGKYPELVNWKDYDDRTALHIAAFHGCLKAAEVLINCDANVNAKDRWNNSPLADATVSKHEDMVKLLKSKGGLMLGCHGQEFKSIAPPTTHHSDWEIDPSEIDLEHSERIGKGSFGEIRMASWRGTPVAVKTILPSLSKDKMVVQDFIHEVDLLMKLRHPNIVQFLGAVTVRPPLMLITEYLTGGDLHVVLKEHGPLPAVTIVNYALDIARGMAYLHNGPNLIIHRDLKPRNVLLGENDQLKVGDFGLSKLIRGKNMHDIYRMTGETGSYRYMAPEVFEHQRYDKSVDVFSFAVILFEMFECSPPFSDLDAYEAARVTARKGKRPPFTSKDFPDGMTELIKECWDQRPELRPEFHDIIPRLEQMKAALNSTSKEHHHMWSFVGHS